MLRRLLTVILGALASWGLGFFFFLVTAKAYRGFYFLHDNHVYLEPALAGLVVGLLVGAAGSVLVIALQYHRRNWR
jgi:H+/Cl- antiporter ClcA